MEGKDNPANDASTGLDPRKDTSSSRCFNGSAFLWQREEFWSSYSKVTCVGDDDPKIKMDVKVSAVQLANDVPENVEKSIKLVQPKKDHSTSTDSTSTSHPPPSPPFQSIFFYLENFLMPKSQQEDKDTH